MMKIFLAVLFSFFSFLFSAAQSNFIVTGKITNEVTGQPMPAASVFAQNTTFGTVTDEDGNFKLQLPAGGYDLVITYTGFRTESRRITTGDAADKINISMKEKEKELEVVAIAATNEVKDGLAKYGSFFNEEFIGKTNNSQQTSIQNPEALHFFFSKKRNRLKVTADAPLIIKNNALGYNIKYTLDSFTHEYATQVSVYTGYPLFEEMQGDSLQRIQWENARAATYKGSVLHFMRSVFNKELKAEQFEIQFIIKANDKESALKLKDPYAALNYQKDDSTQTVEILPNQPEVGILYSGQKPPARYLEENPGEPADFEFSIFSFRPKETIVIERNGYFYEQNDVAISGYLATEKVAQQLPYDYAFLKN